MVDRIRVAVVYGGRSSERGVSAVSAGNVIAALDPARYDVVPIGITPDGRWLLTGATHESLTLRDRTLPTVSEGTEVVLTRGAELVTLDGTSAGAVDVVFPVLHGRFGEDGTVQGQLEMADVPYVGSGVLASAAGMDKEYTKILLRAAGLDVGEFAVLRRDRPRPDVRPFGLPLFVKPARGGSSVGVSRVDSWDALDAAVELAFDNDDKVLVEAAVAGHEIECGVLEGTDGAPQASVPAEIRMRPGRDWYDFEAKYLDDVYDLDMPPVLPDETVATIRDSACRVFTALGCAGLARVDFFVTDERVIVNEINTMPGFTTTSLFPVMWAASGVEFPEIVDRLVTGALRRG